MRLLCLLVLSSVISLGQDAASIYRQAVDRQRQGDLAAAVQLYRQTLTLDPANIAARSNLGAALAGLGRFTEAIPEYEAALKNAPEQLREPLQRNLALAWYKSGHFAEAVPLFLAFHRARPSEKDNAMLAADCFLQLGEAAKAVEILEPLVSAASYDKAFAYVLGVAYLKTSRAADAQRTLDLLFKDTSSAEGNYALGMAAFASGDFPSAVKALERAIVINPALPHIQSAYGQALLFTGDPDAALAAFRKQLEADPNDYDANFQSAAILSRRGKNDEATKPLDLAVSLRPQSAEARFARAQAYLATNRTPEAVKQLQSLTKDLPEYGAAHSLLADAYAKSGSATAAAREKTLAAKYSLKTEHAASAGPQPIGLKPGDSAPHFRLAHADGSLADIPNPERGKPAVLVFGSYSCPNFRGAAPALNELAKTYDGRVPFLLVYIREAHSTDQWQSTRNERERVELAPASTNSQKAEYATMCQRKLHLRFTSAVDGLDNHADTAYAAWPSKVFVVSASGKVLYSSGLTEQDFHRPALEAAIRRTVLKKSPASTAAASTPP